MAKGNTMTVVTGEDTGAFIAAIENEQKRADCEALVKLMSAVTGEPPRLWGTIIGFGQYHYRYETGHEGDTFLVGLSPRKAAFSLYIHGSAYSQVADRRDALLARLGPHTMGKGCLYVKGLADVDVAVLEELLRLSVDTLRQHHPGPGKG